MQLGDKQAFAQIYDLYSDALYGVCMSILQTEDEAKDALQEGFVKIWKNAPKFDASKGRLFTWMINIVRNTCIDRYRKKRKQQSHEIQKESTIVSNMNAGSDSIKINHIGIKDLTGRLEDEQIEIVEYLYYKGYTQQETADELNLPLGTVKTRARIAIRELRKYFDIT